LWPLLVLLPLAACGGGSPSTPSPGGGTGTGTTITITSAGVSTTQLTISPGTRVLFVNNDSRSHNMTSDPHPEHSDCPEINSVGLLQPNQSRETGNLVAIRTCGFHDHDDPPPGGNKWTGKITVR
jgi:plastocyanin